MTMDRVRIRRASLPDIMTTTQIGQAKIHNLTQYHNEAFKKPIVEQPPKLKYFQNKPKVVKKEIPLIKGITIPATTPTPS